MTFKRNLLFALAFSGLLPVTANAQLTAPAPYGAIPTKAQIEWQKLGYYMFIHFGPNTFTDKEWGDGKEDPKVFNPTNLDCRQWARTAKQAGMKGIIITAKHHDGFCLWPSKYSTHTVRESLWKNGKGDILRELSDACKEYGLKFGVYLSPWDRNHPQYGTSEYNQVFANTLDEVLGNYGDVFEQWFDGANGEGENGKKQSYDWDLFHKTVYKNHPNAIIFSDIGPGCRWIGNEEGVAGETNWSRLHVQGFEPGKKAPKQEVLNEGNIDGEAWVPGEVNTSIRPGWFYSPSTDDKVKSVEKLVDFYYTSQGRNGNMLLNVPPDRSGRINAIDSTRLMKLRKAIDDVFEHNLLGKGTTVQASATRANSGKYAATNLLDNNYDSYWTTDDNITTASLIISLPKHSTFNRLLLQEYIPLGQRVASFNAELWDNKSKSWKTLSSATTIGYKRILRFPAVSGAKIRINITKSLACPVLSTVAVYNAPEVLSAPSIIRSKEGRVSISCDSNDPVIHFTTDGSTPTIKSPVYKAPFFFKNGGAVKAIAAVNGGKSYSDVRMEEFELAPEKWSLLPETSNKYSAVIDGNYASAAEIPSEIPLVIDLGSVYDINGFFYAPLNNTWSPNISKYSIEISQNAKDWTPVIVNGQFNNIKNSPVRQKVNFGSSYQARYIRITVNETVKPSSNYTVAEFGVLVKH